MKLTKRKAEQLSRSLRTVEGRINALAVRLWASNPKAADELSLLGTDLNCIDGDLVEWTGAYRRNR